MNNPWLRVSRSDQIQLNDKLRRQCGVTHWLEWLKHTDYTCILPTSSAFFPLTYFKSFWHPFIKIRQQGIAPQKFCLPTVKNGAQPRSRPHVKSSLKSTLWLNKRPFTSSATWTKACCLHRIYLVCLHTLHVLFRAPKHTVLTSSPIQGNIHLWNPFHPDIQNNR